MEMNFQIESFDRDKHIFRSDAFEELIKDAIRFFNGTPVCHIPPSTHFAGTGVYALYYVGKSEFYRPLYESNRLEFKNPIYVGKAVPKGWRQARVRSVAGSSAELYLRLNDHARSLAAATNLDREDFFCRFVILEGAASDMISTVEAALIRHYKPIWNNCVDGFGNHDPGKGRYNQAKSDWDVLHPGREWASRCVGRSVGLAQIRKRVVDYFAENE